MLNACMVHDAVHSSRSYQERSSWFLSMGSTSIKKSVCLYLNILTSKYQSRIDDGMQIDCTSDMINVLDEVARNNVFVLNRRINNTSSWMTLKTSEVQDYSWRISTRLVNFLVSSSSCHAFLPLAFRPMKAIWEIFLKIIFNSPELNRSTIFSMYLFSMAKKMDKFLWYVKIGEWISTWFNIGPSSFPYQDCSRWRASRFSSGWFCFGLWSACNVTCIKFQRKFFELHFMRNSDPRVRIVYVCKLISTPSPRLTCKATSCNIQYGPNFGVPLDLSFWLWCFFVTWQSVFTTSHNTKMWELCSVFRHEIL